MSGHHGYVHRLPVLRARFGRASMIDIRASFVPDGCRAELDQVGVGQSEGMPAIPAWSAAHQVAAMDRLGGSSPRVRSAANTAQRFAGVGR